jgi:hypothetical protein
MPLTTPSAGSTFTGLPALDNTTPLGSSTLRFTQLFLTQSGIKIGDGTNGPTITATGTSPNESLVLTPTGTGQVVMGVGGQSCAGSWSAAPANYGWFGRTSYNGGTNPIGGMLASGTRTWIIGGGDSGGNVTLCANFGNSNQVQLTPTEMTFDSNTDIVAGKLVRSLDNTSAATLGSSAYRWYQLFLGPSGVRLGNGTNGPTITASGTSPNEGLNFTTVTGNFVFSGGQINTPGLSSSLDISVGQDRAFYWLNRSAMKSPSDGVVTLSNQAQTGFTRLELLGTGAVRLGATAQGQVSVSADTTSGDLLLTPPSGGLVKVAANGLVLPTRTPSSATDTGTAGTITWDSSYIYVCTATNTWRRVAISTW